jgi:hypothetical protein
VKDEKAAETANKKAGGNDAAVTERKVMVASDGGSEEARTALQWALSHAVRPATPSSSSTSSGEAAARTVRKPEATRSSP